MGQTAAFGAALYVVTQMLEGPIDRIPWQQHHMIEETSELIAAVFIVIALAARHGLSRSGNPLQAPPSETRGAP